MRSYRYKSVFMAMVVIFADTVIGAVSTKAVARAAFGAGPPSRSATDSQYASQSERPSAKDASQLDGVNQGRSKYESTALNQLTANMLEVMAQGEKSVSPLLPPSLIIFV